MSRTEYQKQWAIENRDAVIKSKRKYNIKNRETINEKARIRKSEQRLLVLSHYSNGELKCACCGESEYLFLTIDHINGGGRKHRDDIHHGHLEIWLIMNNFPEGYQILCSNCNTGRARNGDVCPHQNSR